jgi:CheY-like chemotaxis protein
MAEGAHTDRINAPTLLLADDDEDFRSSLAQVLDGDGYDVVPVPNGAGALALLETLDTE